MNKIAVLFLVNLIGVTYQADTPWNYENEDKWPAECLQGHQQSPINIVPADTVVDRHGVHIRGPLMLRGYREIKMSATNNGHTLMWSVANDWPAPVMSGGPLRGNYSLAQFHLHWLSEHAIDGKKYPLEIHMVHVKTGLKIEEALARPDGLAVLGILAEVQSNEDSTYALKQIMSVVPDLLHRTEHPTEYQIIDATRFFSPNIQSYFTYHGSLTTPACQEAVTWIVMEKPITISDLQYKELSMVDVGGISNFRSLQPVNRVVYRSNSCMLSPGFFGILALINCFSSFSEVFKKSLCAALNFKKNIFGENVPSLKECAKISVSQ